MTFIYGAYRTAKGNDLLKHIRSFSVGMLDHPWLLIGDFNFIKSYFELPQMLTMLEVKLKPFLNVLKMFILSILRV